MKKILYIILLITIVTGFKTDKPAYRLFNSEGKNSNYEKVLKEASSADVVFLVNYIIIQFVIGYNMNYLWIYIKEEW